MRGISLIGKILIFKTLGISKLQYIASMAQVPDKIIQQQKSIQKKFLWKSNTPKIKHSTLIGDCKDGGVEECRDKNMGLLVQFSTTFTSHLICTQQP